MTVPEPLYRPPAKSIGPPPKAHRRGFSPGLTACGAPIGQQWTVVAPNCLSERDHCEKCQPRKLA